MHKAKHGEMAVHMTAPVMMQIKENTHAQTCK